MPRGWLPDCGFGDDGDDAPRVRKPTCRCVYGRPPLLASAAQDDEDETDDGLCAPPPPRWMPTTETLVLEALIAADGHAPLFEESVDLWRDDLDPHSFGFFRVRVRAHERFWVAYSRFFIRVRVRRLRLLGGVFAVVVTTPGKGVYAGVYAGLVRERGGSRCWNTNTKGRLRVERERCRH